MEGSLAEQGRDEDAEQTRRRSDGEPASSRRGEDRAKNATAIARTRRAGPARAGVSRAGPQCDDGARNEPRARAGSAGNGVSAHDGCFHLNHKVPHVVSPRAKNGKVAAIPVLEDGLRAALQFIKMDAFGKWRTEPANRALAKAAERAGRKPFTTYQIRHSFATGLRQSGADVADIQDTYGHTNPETTKIYAPAALEKHQKAIGRLRAADEEGADGNAGA